MTSVGIVMSGCWQINSILANIGRGNSIRILKQYPFFWFERKFEERTALQTVYATNTIQGWMGAASQRTHDVIVTSKRRHDVVLTSSWRYYCAMCPLGYCDDAWFLKMMLHMQMNLTGWKLWHHKKWCFLSLWFVHHKLHPTWQTKQEQSETA